MTKAQIAFLRKNFNGNNGKGKTVAGSVFYVFDNTVVYRDHNEFVVFDDANEMVYCIGPNNNTPIKFESPYSVIATGYEHLQFVEANLSYDGLMSLMDGMFKSMIPAKQKEFIKRWADALPSHNSVEPNTGDYFMESAPKIPNLTVNRDMLRQTNPDHNK